MSDCLAVAYMPELEEPGFAEIQLGSFAVSMPAKDVRVVFHPGANKVQRALWERCKQVESVKELLDKRVFEEIELSSDAEAGDADEGSTVLQLSQVDVKAANRLINHCRYVPQLEAWHDTETRMTLRAAIKRRIANLQQGAEV